jgi:hypothetical protein
MGEEYLIHRLRNTRIIAQVLTYRLVEVNQVFLGIDLHVHHYDTHGIFLKKVIRLRLL